MVSKVFSYTGALQYFTVPVGVYKLNIKVWGAGGGGSASTGAYNAVSGAGGYSYGELYVTPGQVLEVMVGQGGIYSSRAAVYGGGGIGGNASTGWYGSSGGGRSGVAYPGQSQFIIAGGGGGSGIGVSGGLLAAGNGGGPVGNDEYIAPSAKGYASLVPAKGGTQVTGGTGASSTNGSVPTSVYGFPGVALKGATGGTEGNSGGGGGGGGGYYGGGGGIGSYEPYNDEGGGGGGSGYIDTSILHNAQTLASTQTTIKQTVYPPNTGDPDYVAGVGIGIISPSSGGNGLVVFNYPDPLVVTKSVDRTYVTLGDTLNYTVTIQNTANATLNNVLFVDTLPLATSFVANSLIIDGTPTTGNPSPPGLNLGTFPINALSTLTFQVIVNSISPNPITNIAQSSIPGLTLRISSNTISTTISAALLSSSKLSKAYANVGYVLTYTLPIKNVGNTTAFNIIFKDSIPDGTTLVPNSFKQDSTLISGSPNPPRCHTP